MPPSGYSGPDRASYPPLFTRPSSTLEKLISDKIPLKDILDGALVGSYTLYDEIQEAKTARARLQAFIDSSHEEKDPCPKTVQEIGHYNTELREWTAQLAKLEAEMSSLQMDIAHLNHTLSTPIRRPAIIGPFSIDTPYETLHGMPICPPTATTPMTNLYASPWTPLPVPATVPDMSSWAKGLDEYGRCTRQRREGRYHIIMLAPNDSPERGRGGNRWTPDMGYECVRREAEAEAKGSKEQ